MINFLHNFEPNAILFSFGFLTIYWYGFFIVLGILASLSLTLKLSEYYKIKKNDIVDLSFWLILFGIIGARIYHVFLEFSYYLENPLNILKIWNGGIAIHGALIAGIITILIWCKKKKINYLLLTFLITPGLALAQAIGRWGNYFNQELFGKPTEMPWGIPISIANRPVDYSAYNFFHPTFLYESIGNFIIFLILLLVNFLIIKYKKFNNKIYILSISAYLIMYSILRFSLEFVRIDKTPEILNLRWPQIVSLIIIFLSIILAIFSKKITSKKSQEREKTTK